jgi:hypothetical protein
MNDGTTGSGDDGFDRRTLLKKIAVAGSVAWAVPVVNTLNMRAANAQTASPRTECYCVEWKPSDTPQCGEQPSGRGTCGICPPDTVAGGCASGHFSVGLGGNGTWVVTMAPGCTFLDGVAYSKCAAPAVCEPAAVGPSATAATFFPCGDEADHTIHHIEFVFCCEVA